MKDHLDPADEASAAHAASMDRKYRIQRFAYNATRRYFLLGRNEAIAKLDLQSARHVIEIGCGTGRNIELMQKASPSLAIDAIDISSAMLQSAEARVGRNANVRLARADAGTFEPEAVFGRRHYDAVLMSYTLSMIPDWRAALARGLAAVAPGGRLVIADFGDFAGFGALKETAKRALARHQAPPRENLSGETARIATGIGQFIVASRPLNLGFNQIIVAVRAG